MEAISHFIHIAEVARTQCQLHMFLFAGLQMESEKPRSACSGAPGSFGKLI